MKVPTFEMNRRSFLGLGATAAVAAGFGLAGCSPQASSSAGEGSTASAAQTVELPVGAPKGTPKTATWCAVPEAIADVAEEKSFDVVVVGAGLAGLAAAATAAESGATVAVIETLSTYQTRGQDIGTVNSSFQKANGLEASESDINDMCLALQRYAGNRTDQRLYRVWGQRSGSDFDWWYNTMLEPKGYGIEIPRWPMEVEYDPVDGEWFPQFCNQQEFTVPEGEEAGMNGGFPGAVGELEAYAKGHGAEFFYEHRGRQLVRGGQPNGTEGRVEGVIAEASDGSYVKFTATKGVILATGDYGHNEDMMQAWCPSQAQLAIDTNVYPSTGNVGDGHLMGMWIGGMMQGIPHAYMAHGTPGSLGSDPFLLVDINGRRFTNEDIPGQSFSDLAEEQPQTVFWQIADAKYPEQLKWSSPTHGAQMSFSGDIDAWNAAIETGDKATIEAMLTEQGVNMQYAWTVEELAEGIHVDAATLQETLDRYNGFAHDGYDADFGKQAKRLWPVETPPYFYSSSGQWAFMLTMGGLKGTEKAEAIDAWGNPIPGLWMAGNVQGMRFAIDYPTIVCGLSHSLCLTFGRVAGEQAAAADSSVTEHESVYAAWKEANPEGDAAGGAAPAGGGAPAGGDAPAQG